MGKAYKRSMGTNLVSNSQTNNSKNLLSAAELSYQASNGDKEAQFQLGMTCLKKAHYQKAERWFRYAAIQGHYEAYRSLILGTRHQYFLSTTNRIHSLVIEILETLATPKPTQEQIDELEAVITYHLNTEFNLMKLQRNDKE